MSSFRHFRIFLSYRKFLYDKKYDAQLAERKMSLKRPASRAANPAEQDSIFMSEIL